jgi:hypothetical protein
LLVTAAGSGHCLTAAVYEPHGRGFRKLWSASEMPQGAGFCHPSLCRDARAWAAKKNQVIVSVPGQREDAEMGVCDENTVLTYKGAGKTYVLANTETVAAHCDTEDYMRGVSEAFAPEDGRRSGTERVVTVFAISTFGVEPAIAIEKTAHGIEVDRLAFREEPLGMLASHWKSQTPSQCIAEAKSLPIDKTPLSISAGDARWLVDELNKINRIPDRCPRRADGTCAQIFDGTLYSVVFPDGFVAQLQEVKGLRDVRSENPALLDWVHKVLLFVPPPQRQKTAK